MMIMSVSHQRNGTGTVGLLSPRCSHCKEIDNQKVQDLSLSPMGEKALSDVLGLARLSATTRDLGQVAWQRPRPTLRQGCTCWVGTCQFTGDHGTSNLNCHYPPKWVARQRLSPNLGGVVARDWRRFCHRSSKSAGTLSCHPAPRSKP